MKDTDMTSEPRSSANILDAMALERDLAKLKRPITEYRGFFVCNLRSPSIALRAIPRERFRSNDILYIGSIDEFGEVLAMCNRLNQYLRMVHSLSGGGL